MPMKEILQRLQPMQLYIVLALSAIYFLFQLFLSHTTHSLTLLVDSYHMLCNIIALTGCILTIKHGDCKITTPSSSSTSLSTSKDESLSTSQSANKDKGSKSSNEIVVNIQLSEDINKKKNSRQQQQHERSLKNTFGWARIDILTMLIVCTFMASLCFSSLVEAIQTLCHIHHQDAMHNPIWVLMLGILGLVLNGLCYLMIGGYTYHQGSFLHITSSGAVILDHVATGEAVRHGERRLSRTRKSTKPKIDEKATKRESVREMFRDVCSTVCVIVCALVVFMIGEEPTLVDSHDSDSAEALISTVDPLSESLINDLVQHGYSRFVDPIGAIISCIVLLYLSYPYMKESGLILLQTIPATIDIEEFKKNLLESFTEILNVHDLHIWQLNASKYVSTAHIIFHDQKVYTALNDAIINYFHAQGIEKVTIQPEFQSILPTSPLLINKRESGASIECLMQCQEDACFERHCCKNDEAFKKIAEAKNSTKCAIKTTNGGVENKATKVEISLPNTRKPTIIETNEIKTSDLKTDS